ncbi:MAG: hypothetical protein HY914_03640 [Desulfomonile tiedjei]|nr:hypothetical protein [Desulfomonile tiedjei]
MASRRTRRKLMLVVAMVLNMSLFMVSPSSPSESGFSLNTGSGYKTPPMGVQFRWEMGLDGKERLVQWNGFDFTRKVWQPDIDDIEQDIQAASDRIRGGAW